ncbi:MAG: Adenylate cyclase 2 [Chlamydiae bacterium]|nr:Adenylate cyclase 2 [Chlamydiota bacterium]
MSLRYRLFIWVAGVFCITFIASFFLEDYLTRVNLKRTYNDLVKKLEVVNDEKTREIEAYLGDMLYRIQGDVDAVLQGVAKYQLIRNEFAPSLKNEGESNWLDSASLMITSKWIDFIQSMNEDELMSGIFVDGKRLNDVIQFQVAEDFDLVSVRSNRGHWEGPYIAINVNISSLHGDGVESGGNEAEEEYFAFFTPQALQSLETEHDHPSLDLSINLLEPFLKWLEVPSETYYLAEVLERIRRAQRYLRENPTAIPSGEAWQRMVEKRIKSLNLEKREKEPPPPGEYYEDQAKHYVRRFVEHYNKIGLIWGLSTITHSDLFGKSPLAAKAPIGLGMIDRGSRSGKVLLSKNAFYDQPKYDVTKALVGRKTVSDEFLTTHLDIIAPSGMHHVYFGNTLKLQDRVNGKIRTGYLTLGMDGSIVLESLARSTHRNVLFVSGEKIISVSNPEGDEISDAEWYAVPTEQILAKAQGVIKVGGVEYFFLHVAPYKKIDLHFFIFTPKKEEFALINSLNEEAANILKKISLQMRLASIGGLLFVLIFLNNIAKRITRPIAHLAEVTGAVAEGKLHEIEIPEIREKKRHDEVSALYHSFFEMVKGLREKERVRGVLNKVVSKEIAEEALKGNIQLGGEEKRVTVFFADIRHFTEMTEKMAPKEVIQLVNGCMTKVSDIIDKHGGVIDKYVGDEVMALFGAPIDLEEGALRAIKCGIDIREALKEWNRERKDGPPIEMGIGIHTGTVIAGNMGAENRLNYTVLGSNVNLASRLCSEATEMEVLISENTYEEKNVKENVEVEAKDAVSLRGFTTPVAIFTVKGYTGAAK